MKANFIKVNQGLLAPATDEDRKLLDKVRAGQVVQMQYSRMRNYQFFKKWWALVNFAFDYWQPVDLPADSKWKKSVVPERNLERFRKDLTILAGFYTATYRINGEVRIEAKSISFASMSEDEFEQLYSATIDAVLKHVCTQYSAEELDSIVEQALAFAA